MRKTLFLPMLAMLASGTAAAYDFEAVNDDGVSIYYNRNIDGTTVAVTFKDNNYHSYSGVVAIPEKVTCDDMEYTVTAIGPNAFDSCDDLIFVILPRSIANISKQAFAFCNALTEVDIPAAVTSIEASAFEKCISLMSFKVRAEEPEQISLGEDIFNGVPLVIGTLYVPEGSRDLYAEAPQWKDFDAIVEAPYDFMASNDQDVPIYYILNADGRSVSVSYKSLNEISYSGDITIPAEVKYRTRKCPVTAIGEYGFYNCKNLTGVTLPESLIEVGEHAFSYCESLESLELPAAVTTVASGAFNFCKKLARINIPEETTAIGDNAFSNCKALKNIEIPASVTAIGSYAFQFCTALETVRMRNPDPAEIFLGYNVFYYSPVAECTLYVPRGSRDLYADASQWKEFGSILESSRAGDANGDGSVSVTDLSYVIDFLLEKSHSDFDSRAADMNNDGQITLSDLSAIINIILAN